MDPGPSSPTSIPVDAPGARRIARNALASVLRGGITVPLGLLVTAWILDRLGPGVLGFWSLMATFTSPMVPLSFGIAPCLVRQAALVREDRDALMRVVSTGLAIHAALLVFLGGLYFLVAPGLHAWLAERSGLPLEPVRHSVHFAALSFAAILGSVTFAAALAGLEDFPATQTAVTANALLLTVLVVIFLTPGASMVRLFQATAAASLLQALLQVIFLTRRLGRFPVSPGHLDETRAREILAESARLFAIDAYRSGFYLVDKWVITAFLGAAATGYYELGSRLGTLFRGLLNTLATPLLAASAAASTSPLAAAKLERLTFYSLRYMAGVAIPLALLVGVEAGTLLALWIGSVPPDGSSAVRLLVPAYLLNAFTVASLYLIAGRGRSRLAMIASFAGLALNLTLDLVAIHLHGTFASVLVAALVASALTSLGLVGLQSADGTLPLARLGKSALRFTVAAIGALCLVQTLPAVPFLATRVLVGAHLLLELLLGALLYGVLLVAAGELDPQDRYFLTSAWRGSPA